MAMLLRVCLSFTLVFFCRAVQAQSMPSADELFNTHTKRLGFADALVLYSTVEAHAHVTVAEREYDTIVKASISHAGLGDAEFTIVRDGVATLYADHSGVLTRSVGPGVAEPLAEGMRGFVWGHQFHLRVLFPKLMLPSIDSPVSEAIFGDTPAYKVVGKTHEGDRLIYYFDTTSKILLGFSLVVTEESGPNLLEFTLGDWSTTGGETVFWRLEIVDKADLYIYEFNKILLLP